MQIFSEDFIVDVVCITLPFVLKYQDFGPPKASSGTALFCLYHKIMTVSMLLLFMPFGTGLDKSAQGLAALHYEMLPAAGQVVCKRLNHLLSEAAARSATVRWAAVR